MNRDNFRIRPSQSGGLHATSMGSLYPWSVQPRVVVCSGCTLCDGAVTRIEWVAFNALTGYVGLRRDTYDQAEQDMHRKIVLAHKARQSFAEWEAPAYKQQVNRTASPYARVVGPAGS